MYVKTKRTRHGHIPSAFVLLTRNKCKQCDTSIIYRGGVWYTFLNYWDLWWPWCTDDNNEKYFQHVPAGREER